MVMLTLCSCTLLLYIYGLFLNCIHLKYCLTEKKMNFVDSKLNKPQQKETELKVNPLIKSP